MLHQILIRLIVIGFANKEVLMPKAAKPIPEGFRTITPQLALDNAAQTIEWYKPRGKHFCPRGVSSLETIVFEQ